MARTSPCELLFKDEVAQALGRPVEAADQNQVTAQDGSGWIEGCLFRRRAGDEVAPLEVSLAFGPEHVAAFDALHADAVTSEPGLGDEALLRLQPFWGLDAPIGALFVRLGDAVLALQLGILDIGDDGGILLAGNAEQQAAILRQLAGIALDRLTAPPSTVVATCDLLAAAGASALGGPGVVTTEAVDNHDVWGPGCAYLDAAGTMRLFVAVSDRASAGPNFDTCTGDALAKPIAGLGDAAFFTRSCQVVAKFKYMADPMVMARLGSTVVTVTMPPPTGTTFEEYEELKAWITEVARAVLARLGGATMPTPAPSSGPVGVDPQAHPCALLTNAEASAGVKVAVTATREDPGQPGYPARCFFTDASISFTPLEFKVATGADAESTWAVLREPDYQAVAGLGDGAYKGQLWTFEVNSTQMVRLFVRKGGTVVSLYLHGNGWVGQAGGEQTAPGNVDEQLAILRHFAELILARL